MSRTPRQYVSENELLMREWNFEKNSALGFSPDALGINSSKIVWWVCPQGHKYDMCIAYRAQSQGCPVCLNRRILPGYNDLATTNPDLLDQWDYRKNTVIPQQVSHGSGKKIWWICSKGHSYQQAISKKTSRDFGCPVCSGHLVVSGINDFATFYPAIAKEWHPTKNGTLKPSDVSKKSGKKIWWICRWGHEWQATPHDRVTSSTGCPICNNRRQTSFAEQSIFFYVKKLYPDAINRFKDIFDNGMELDIYVPSIHLAIEFDGAAWHDTEEAHKKERQKYDICREKKITLLRVKEQTGKRWKDVADVVYTVPKKGSAELQLVIQTIVDSIDVNSNMWTRTSPRSIHSNIVVDLERDANEIREYLSPLQKSLANQRPDLVKEWNYERNGNLRPEMFVINSNDKVWWKCSTCGHEWQTAIIHRGGKRKSGCPECAKQKHGETFTKRKVSERGSLAERNPALASEWHPTKNGNLTPSDITEKRFANVWWKCPKCGHEWEASPNNRSKGIGCPCCSGRVPKTGENDLKTLYPEVAKEWNYEKNGELKPESFLPKSGIKVWWRCSICGNEWETAIRNRTNGHGCPHYRSHTCSNQYKISSFPD